jgi:phosphatidylglycerophosphate synthase
VVPVRNGLAAGAVALLALLAGLGTTSGLGGAGLAVGIGCGAVTSVAVSLLATRCDTRALGPADLVTLTRLMVACAVAALVAQSFLGRPGGAALVSLAVVALTLDAVDGRVARRTGTMSAFGARFDGEADAFLLLVLSAYVARPEGPWVLLIGLARYAFAVAGQALPWLRGQLPVRYWAKAVTAIQGVVLTVAAADVTSPAATSAALVLALALLAESFAWSTLWLWRHRPAGPVLAAAPAGRDRVRVP